MYSKKEAEKYKQWGALKPPTNLRGQVMYSKDDAQKYKEWEIQERQERQQEAAEKIKELMEQYNVKFKILAVSPSGVPVAVEEAMFPNWQAVVNLVAA
jgi:hypothetical protein